MNKEKMIEALRKILKVYHYESKEQHISKDVVTEFIEIMKKETKKFIIEFLEFWPLSIVTPVMILLILFGNYLGW